MLPASDEPELAIRPGEQPGLFDVDCLRCGGTEVMDGDAPVVSQIAVFHLLHGSCVPRP